jgi:hypothetical protein
MRSSLKVIGLIATFVAPALASAQTDAPRTIEVTPGATYPSAADPRSNLKPGRFDAGEAAKGMRLVSFSRKPPQFDSARGLAFIDSDIVFGTHFVYQGNFAGFTIWDVTDPAKPVIASVTECISSQGDPKIAGDLMFLSAEGAGNRTDCSKGGVQDPKDHFAGVRIYNVSNPRAPKLIKNVQTCKGSHTYTVVPSPTDPRVVYLYLSGQQTARPATELAGCKNGTDAADPTNSLYMLDIIKVPLDHPEQAHVIPGARIFTGLQGSPDCAQFCVPVDPRFAALRRGRGGPDSAINATLLHTGPHNCHDVTAYPALHLLGAACTADAIIVDISNPERPVRLAALMDTNNYQGRHTAGFSNDGKETLWTNEWGGGTGPMCQATSMMEQGGNTIVELSDNDKKMTQRGYFKIPAAKSDRENCVAHNGGLVPVPGRNLYVQGWYQGGVDVMDFTNPDHPFEIAYFSRGPIDPPGDTSNASGRARYTIGGSWGAYYWNGYVYSSELDRGFDVLELTPSPQLSANELAAARLVRFKEYNPTSQPKLVWPAAYVVVRSYLDQIVRNDGLAADRTTAISEALDAAEQKNGAAAAAALTALAKEVEADASGAKDAARVRTMATEIKRLAAVQVPASQLATAAK